MKTRRLATLGAAWVATQGVLLGQDPGLGGRLDHLKAAAQSDPNLSSDLKAALVDVADALGKQGTSSSLTGLMSRMKWYGDFRLRHESDFRLDDQESRNRERIRLRLGFDHDINDQIVVGARLTTGNASDENTPHQNLGLTFDKLSISLDRVFATWKPPSLPGSWITAGKFQHPFEVNPVFAEVVFDADIQPDGIIGGWKGTMDGLGDVGVMAGEYIILDNATSGTLESAWATVGQVYAKQKIGDGRLTEAFGIYRYQELNPDDVNNSRFFLDNNGNAVKDTTGDGIPDDFASRFTVYNPILAYEQGDLTLSSEYFWNPRAASSEDSGYAVGVKYGRTKAPGDWQFYYQYQVMEQDATVSSFTNDDVLFGTNYRAHLAGVKWQALERTEVHLWGSANRRDERGTAKTNDSGQTQWRVRLDITFKF